MKQGYSQPICVGHHISWAITKAGSKITYRH